MTETYNRNGDRVLLKDYINELANSVESEIQRLNLNEKSATQFRNSYNEMVQGLQNGTLIYNPSGGFYDLTRKAYNADSGKFDSYGKVAFFMGKTLRNMSKIEDKNLDDLINERLFTNKESFYRQDVNDLTSNINRSKELTRKIQNLLSDWNNISKNYSPEYSAKKKSQLERAIQILDAGVDDTEYSELADILPQSYEWLQVVTKKPEEKKFEGLEGFLPWVSSQKKVYNGIQEEDLTEYYQTHPNLRYGEWSKNKLVELINKYTPDQKVQLLKFSVNNSNIKHSGQIKEFKGQIGGTQFDRGTFIAYVINSIKDQLINLGNDNYLIPGLSNPDGSEYVYNKKDQKLIRIGWHQIDYIKNQLLSQYYNQFNQSFIDPTIIAAYQDLLPKKKKGGILKASDGTKLIEDLLPNFLFDRYNISGEFDGNFPIPGSSSKRATTLGTGDNKPEASAVNALKRMINYVQSGKHLIDIGNVYSNWKVLNNDKGINDFLTYYNNKIKNIISLGRNRYNALITTKDSDNKPVMPEGYSQFNLDFDEIYKSMSGELSNDLDNGGFALSFDNNSKDLAGTSTLLRNALYFLNDEDRADLRSLVLDNEYNIWINNDGTLSVKTTDEVKPTDEVKSEDIKPEEEPVDEWAKARRIINTPVPDEGSKVDPVGTSPKIELQKGKNPLILRPDVPINMTLQANAQEQIRKTLHRGYDNPAMVEAPWYHTNVYGNQHAVDVTNQQAADIQHQAANGQYSSVNDMMRGMFQANKLASDVKLKGTEAFDQQWEKYRDLQRQLQWKTEEARVNKNNQNRLAEAQARQKSAEIDAAAIRTTTQNTLAGIDNLGQDIYNYWKDTAEKKNQAVAYANDYATSLGNLQEQKVVRDKYNNIIKTYGEDTSKWPKNIYDDYMDLYNKAIMNGSIRRSFGALRAIGIDTAELPAILS